MNDWTITDLICEIISTIVAIISLVISIITYKKTYSINETTSKIKEKIECEVNKKVTSQAFRMQFDNIQSVIGMSRSRLQKEEWDAIQSGFLIECLKTLKDYAESSGLKTEDKDIIQSCFNHVMSCEDKYCDLCTEIRKELDQISAILMKEGISNGIRSN